MRGVQIAVCLIGTSYATTDEAHERLMLRPLPKNELMLQFNLSVSTDRRDLRHLELFPRPLAELVVGTGAFDARLSLRSGRWFQNTWGVLPDPAPPGGDISARLPAHGWRDGWPMLRRALGALLCASVVDEMPIDQTAPIDASGDIVAYGSAKSATSDRSAGDPHYGSGLADYVELRTSVARQSVCAENLAAWLQLWPCRDAAGISTLLGKTDGLTVERIRYARYRALQLKLSTHPPYTSHSSGSDNIHAAGGHGPPPRLVLELRLTVVLPRSPRTPKGGDLFGGLLERGLHACALASSSRLTVDLPDVSALALGFASKSTQGCALAAHTGGVELSSHVAEWALDIRNGLALRLCWRDAAMQSPTTQDALAVTGNAHSLVSQAPIQARRLLARDDDTRGLMVLELSNHASNAAAYSCRDRLPGWLVLHWHTLAVYINGTQLPDRDARRGLRFAPSVTPRELQVIEWLAMLPAHSSCALAVRYSIGLFAVDQLPADSSRGLEVGPAAISYSLMGENGLVYTEPVLVALLLPDLSMPYNVISVTSTLIALFVGSMFNLLSRPLLPRSSQYRI